jgi:hypothetical protein
MPPPLLEVVVAEETDGVVLNPEAVLELVEPVWVLVASVLLIPSCWSESKLD